jgi:hypothetical protein
MKFKFWFLTLALVASSLLAACDRGTQQPGSAGYSETDLLGRPVASPSPAYRLDGSSGDTSQ